MCGEKFKPVGGFLWVIEAKVSDCVELGSIGGTRLLICSRALRLVHSRKQFAQPNFGIES